jgi:hypothetical protein
VSIDELAEEANKPVSEEDRKAFIERNNQCSEEEEQSILPPTHEWLDRTYTI